MIRSSKLARGSTLVAGGSLVAALLAACGTGGGSNAPPTQAAPASPTAVAPPATSSPSETATEDTFQVQPLVTAGQTALKKVGHGTITSIDLERGGTMWEVDVVVSGGDKYEVHVSPNGQRVLSGPSLEPEDAGDTAENWQKIGAAELDYNAAAAKVLMARDGRLTELSLDDHGSTVVWQADVERSGQDYDVVIDAATGEVLKNRPSD